ncbi:hypothetical protein HDV00_002524 [Rhizophlyctis rosea]|nr:hypothetical protein HDV00_002524 [Rhizophlyctis rosea]
MSARQPRTRSGGSAPKKKKSEQSMSAPEDGSLSGSQTNLTSKGISAPPDIVYKMSKKIAQLTKVIYYLNTKNEDHNVEVQSLAEAYEDEIEDVIKDAKSRIETHRTAAEEAEIKLQAHEAVIQSYVERIAKMEEDITAAKGVEVKLRGDVESGKKELQDIKRKHLADLDDVRNSVKSFGKTDEDLMLLKNDFDDRIKEEREAFAKEREELKGEGKLKLEELKAFYEKKIKVLNEERQRVDESTKDALTNMKRRFEDESKFFQQECKRLKQELEDRAKDAKANFDSMERRLNTDLDQNRRTISELEQTITEMRLESQSKEDQIRHLEGELTERTAQKVRLEMEMQDQKGMYRTLEESYNHTSGNLRTAEDKIMDLTFQLSEQEIKTQEALTQTSTLTMENESLREQLNGMQKQRDEALTTIEQLKEQVQQLEEDKALLTKVQDQLREFRRRLKKAYQSPLSNCTAHLIQTLESQINSMQEAALHMRQAHEEELKTSMEHLETRLNNEHSAAMAAAKQSAAEQYAALEKEKAEVSLRGCFVFRHGPYPKENPVSSKLTSLQEIADLHTQLADQKATYETKLATAKAAHQTEKADLLDHIAKLNAQIADLQTRLDETKATLDEKVVEISKHLVTIQHNQNTIKNLEIDKADLFQKMVHIDEQIRSEMLEKFRRDKMEMEEDWERKMFRDMEKLRTTMEASHTQEMAAALTKKQEEHDEAVSLLTAEHEEVVRTLKADIENKEGRIAILEYERDKAQKQLVEEREVFVRKLNEYPHKCNPTKSLTAEPQAHGHEITSIIAEHNLNLQAAKTAWEAEAEARERQLKVASTIALANLEKQKEEEKDAVEVTWKGKMEELRAFFAKSGLEAKKEAENLRQSELAALQSQHEEFITKLRDDHASEIAEKVLELNTERIDEINGLVEGFDKERVEWEGEKGKLESVIEGVESAKRTLKEKILDLEGKVESLEQVIREREEEIENNRREAEESHQSHLSDLQKAHTDEIDQLNEDHIQESSRMLSDFEAAQNFLKSQIANLNQQLEAAAVKYINREPRDADVKRIAELEALVEKKQRKITGLLNEIEYFRLEMNNRENNFNKIFNKTPLVGLVQPISKFTSKPRSKSNADLAGSNLPVLPPLYSHPVTTAQTSSPAAPPA